jgi:1-acyl-sn-glycerol-3-phosphate acyltransferase
MVPVETLAPGQIRLMSSLQRIRYALQGVAALLVVSCNTIVLTMAIVVLALFKRIAPKGAIRNTITHWLSSLGELWISVNKLVLWFYRGMKWDIHLPESLDRQGRYLIFCNHQSWVDILVLQYCLNRRVPFMRFMLKQQLIWVPFLGLAWWALDMPFLRRYSHRELLRNPALRGKDLENAAQACEKLKHIPVSMMSFPEGTRFTAAKHEQQKSPYKHLLLPRYGGIGQVLYSFGDALQTVIDVTIFYPDGTPTFWQFISGQVRGISVSARSRPIDEGLRGVNFREDSVAKRQLKTWLNDMWHEKDQLLAASIRRLV